MKKKYQAWREKQNARKSAASNVDANLESDAEDIAQHRPAVNEDKTQITAQPRRPAKTTRFERISLANEAKTTELPHVPFMVWVKVFSNLSLSDSRALALAALGFSEMWREYQKNTQEGCRHILVKRNIFPEDLFIAAEEQGILVNYILLHQFYYADRREALKLTDLPNDNLAPIAAISGDMKWLYQHVPKNNFAPYLKHICFSQPQSVITNLLEGGYVSENDIQRSKLTMSIYAGYGGQVSILDKLGFHQAELPSLIVGGHLDLAWKRCQDELMSLRNTDRVSSLSLMAAESGHFNICDHLEKHYGAVPSAKNELYHASLIHYAAYFDDIIRVNNLLKTLYNFQMPTDKKGHTPLHWAAKGGAEKTTMALLKRYTKYQKMLTLKTINPLILTIIYGHTSLTKLMLAKYPVNVKDMKDELGETLLFEAGRGGKWETFEYLLNQKVPLNINKKGETPLFSAFFNLRVRFISKYVAEFGLECLTHVNKDGESVAFFLLYDDNLNMINYLINKYDINLNATNKKEQTPLLALANKTTLHNEDGWKQIADCAEKFDHLLLSNWQTKPDINNKTFLDIVEQHGQQDKFPQFYNVKKSL